MNTWFENHPSPGDRTRKQLDYILIQECFPSSITSCKTMPGADCESYHVPVVGTIRLELKKVVRGKKAIPTLQMNMRQTDEEIKGNNKIKVGNTFEGLGQHTATEEIWQMMKDSIRIAKGHTPVTNKQEHKMWMITELLDIMENKREPKVEEKSIKNSTKW
ncbi:endonuclease-reverse transcriptase [Plakobranchus ocellatus]|uniref:Endonuclease-reverse transcriptase n=1 Tax=Plakobranchus ocellatus TaxID=259542 RepID=A0AAV4DSS9_9GAST|nr:endonuclease-reverse transcriptase [Plakobranchus ocellatus]